MPVSIIDVALDAVIGPTAVEDVLTVTVVPNVDVKVTMVVPLPVVLDALYVTV